MTDEAKPKSSNTKSLITMGIGATIVALLLALFEFQTGSLGIIPSSLDRANAAVAVGDHVAAENYYKEHIQKNLTDQDARRDFVRFLQDRNRLVEALTITERLILDFKQEQDLVLYEALLQAAYTPIDVRLSSSIKRGKKAEITDALNEMGELLNKVPLVKFPEVLPEKYQFQLTLSETAFTCELLTVNFCFLESQLYNESRAPVIAYMRFELASILHNSKLEITELKEQLVPDLVANNTRQFFDESYLSKHFEEGLEKFTSVLVASSIFHQFMSDPEAIPAAVLTDWCIGLIKPEFGYADSERLKRQKKRLSRGCRSKALDNLLLDPTVSKIRAHLYAWDAATNLFCSSFDDECITSFKSHIRWGLEDPAAIPLDAFLSAITDWFYSSSKAADLFGEKEWKPAAEEYRKRALLLAEFTDAKTNQPQLIAENLYNTAMASWNHDDRKGALDQLKAIRKDYPEYAPAKDKLQEFTAFFERLPSVKPFADYLRMIDEADAEQDLKKALEIYDAAATEYKERTGTILMLYCKPLFFLVPPIQAEPQLPPQGLSSRPYLRGRKWKNYHRLERNMGSNAPIFGHGNASK